MSLNIRIDRGLAILSNISRLMDDPRHFDAAGDVDELLDQGHRRFVIELAGVSDLGPAALGLLTTMTRRIRSAGGDVVLTRVNRGVAKLLVEMQMDDYWEIFKHPGEARDYYRRPGDDLIEDGDGP